MAHAVIARSVTAALTSHWLRDGRRHTMAWLRRARGTPAAVHYFHDAGDPYSHLTAQILPALQSRYRISLVRHAVPPPDAGSAPDAARLMAWSRRDAVMLAAAYGLQVSRRDDAGLDVPGDAMLRDGAALRARLGHYLGATFYFEGEWYWGLDRLHYLEDRLAAQGLDRAAGSPALAPVRDVTLNGARGAAKGHVLHMFLSFRSPYSYIALPRARALARHYGAALRLRFVLPMVMRGLPVPRAKRIYITLDTKREADRLGLPFGKIVDPVGVGVERGLAVLHRAMALGCGEAFAMSFLQGVFAEGVEAASEAGLLEMAERAGVGAGDVAAALADESWQGVAEANRAELLESGLWGVPCFRVDDGETVWGQDRLWVVDDRLQRAAV
jgi:2-hydroxychromene-2-carboxylate isomerase